MQRWFWLLFLMGLGEAQAASADERFLEAREAFRRGDNATVNAIAQQLRGYVLEPYVGYWALKGRLDSANVTEVRQFLTTWADSAVADRLRNDWIKQLAKTQQWEVITQEYPQIVENEIELRCIFYQARLNLRDGNAVREARGLWFNGNNLPDNCSPVFAQLTRDNVITSEDVWQRLRLATENKNLTLAKRIANALPDDQEPSDGQLTQVFNQPNKLLENPPNLRERRGRELVLLAVTRGSRENPSLTARQWENLSGHFSDSERGYAWGQLGMQAARRLNPEALAWFQAGGTQVSGDEVLEWKARAALRQQAWEVVLNAIQAMSPQGQRQSTWRYWKGRALKVQGKLGQANPLFVGLANETSFYGQLALEELGNSFSVPSENWQPSQEEVRQVQQSAGLQRALKLYQLNLRIEGSKEWNWALRGFEDKQLLAAAEFARRNDWYDRAINTAERTTQLHNFGLRYLTPYRETFRQAATQTGVEEAWLYGLTRQESRFINVARSGVGASGLMQLMPATAQWMAKRMGMRDFSPSSINQIDVNVTLGSGYLKTIFDQLSRHPVLATAAYNAGPGRAKNWQANMPLEGAIYVENIPFQETRDYVKKVMSNTLVYSSLLGQRGLPLKQRLHSIPAR